MPRWTDDELRAAVANSLSVYQVVMTLERSAGTPSYRKVRARIEELQLDTTHLGRGRRRPRRWTDEQLRHAVASSYGVAAVIRQLGLVAAGGNYQQVQARMRELKLDTAHFTRSGWNIGLRFNPNPPRPLEAVLVANSPTSSHKLKRRLFRAGLKKPVCEFCGWAERSADGRVPVELDHINGDHSDNRLENLRILCPNCHSLQPTHRGSNQKRRRARVAESG